MAEIATNLEALAERWVSARAGERANLQLYLVELCDALMVGRPGPRGSGYEFELQIDAISVEGRESANFIDVWKTGHFALEGKDHDASNKGKASNEALLRRAYGQVRNYVHHVPGATPPPYLMVLDVGTTLIVWDRWAGTYGGFEAGRRIDLAALHERPDDIALLRDIWENPTARDRRGVAQAVTTDIARKLAELAAALEDRGHEQETVARFLMRVCFSCFAEDVGLLPPESFRQTVTEAGLRGSPAEFTEAVEGLWRHMDVGGRVGPFRFLKFNGHFFKHATALPLTRPELVLLEAAARADWSAVEPAIFGTLLTRALDPEERHRLGAEYTPRAFIERLVRPTIEEPVLERWTAVQAEVLQLTETGRPKDRAAAEGRLRDFHAWMRGLRVLDPACGSGNFLYVAMHSLKRIEHEVLRAIERVSGHPDLRLEEINPSQFYGIEKKRWAREIAELTIWIGFHQFWRQHHDVQPPEPILQDTGSLECRDAVLAWDATRHDPTRDRPDPTPAVPHQVTGELVPDPSRRLSYLEHVGAREAPWPEADFIVGNPPFMGQFRQRDALGDGYVEALRTTYGDVPDAADLVVYWWHRAARAVASGRTIRAGLITTQSITQAQNRVVIADAEAKGVRVTWAIADHYWNDGSDDARVRVAMTVLAKEPPNATLVTVDGDARVTGTTRVLRLNVDLSAHADVPGAAKRPLIANAGVSSPGLKLDGAGFILERVDAERLIAADPSLRETLRPYRNGKDFATRPRGVYLIDFAMQSEAEARQTPVLFDIVRDRVRPEREAKPDRTRRECWWRLGRPRPELRDALRHLPRYIVTPETAKHRLFEFFNAELAPDNSLIVIASDDAFHLGVLSSAIHTAWALAAGSRLGIDGTPRYNKGPCFEAFPFPACSAGEQAHVGDLAERIDQHRKDALRRSDAVTMTGMYNVVERLRAGTTLTRAEQGIHRLAACGTLRDLHDALDAAVASAYGWSWPEPSALILERLVLLHDQRVMEEDGGEVRWLRPTYQAPRYVIGDAAEMVPVMDLVAVTAAPAVEPWATTPWPSDAIGQITALRALASAAPVSVEEVMRRLVGAKRELVSRHFDTLALLGEVVRDDGGRYTLAAGALSAV
jgi:hypothetical protein